MEKEIYSRILNETAVEIGGGGAAGHGGERGAKDSGHGGIKVANKREKESKTHQVFNCLIQGGFTFLPTGEAIPFAVENIDRLMYISVHDGSDSWGWDMPLDPHVYGCVTVKEDETGRISIFPSNPEPRWIQCNKENPTFPRDTVKVHVRPDYVAVYLAKTRIFTYGINTNTFLTGVCKENGKLCRYNGQSFDEQWSKMLGIRTTVDLLVATKYEWAKAQRGNEISPNAVKTVVLFNGKAEEGYVGRVGGEISCVITITDGRINYFVTGKGSKSTSGEVLLLTVDPSA